MPRVSGGEHHDRHRIAVGLGDAAERILRPGAVLHRKHPDPAAGPAWNGGEYKSPPLAGLRGALEVLFFMGSAALPLQAQVPTREAADKLAEEWMAKRLAATDANDFLYAFDASRDYDPSADLGKVETAVTAINSADDEVNPPELGILEREIKRVKRGKAVLLPIGPQTRGHGTHTNAAAWKDHLAVLLERSR